MIRAVIFDMDGTMFDTEVLWGHITARLTERYGAVFDSAVRVQMMGKKDHEALTVLKDFFHLDASVEELITVRRQMIMDDTSSVAVKEGLMELLDLIDELGIKKAVATSSFQAFADKLLAQFDVAKRFTVVVTGDQVSRSKPDPMIFLEAAKRLDVAPAECLVIEDAQNGVEAAHAGGMKVFAIPHDASRHHDFSKATAVLQSMREITRERLASL